MNPGNSSRRTIGYSAAVAIVVGSVIGSGVFMKPAAMAASLPSPLWLISTWIIAGFVSLFGGLLFAELGSMFPETGGIYVYLRKMYGDFPAFLYGWASLTVINTASVAAISFVCAQYADFFLHLPRLAAGLEKSVAWHIPLLGDLFPLQNIGVKALSIVLVLVLTVINYLSVRAGSSLQVVTTALKIGVIGALIVGIFFSSHGNLQNFVTNAQNKEGWGFFGGFVSALTGAFMAYDGWINLTFMGGELRDPQKNFPRSIFSGLFICIVVYILVNQAYLYVLPIDRMAASSLVASDAIGVAWGKTSEAIVAALIVICTFGAINGSLMSEARVTFAMSRDRLFLDWTGKEHPRFYTPGNALWLHAIWASLFILTGSFDMLADMFTFVSWVFYLMGAVGIFVLRKTMPGHSRPYKAWGYPYMPALFILFALFYVASTAWNDVSNYIDGKVPVINSLLGLAITALGIPVYLYCKRQNAK